MIFYQDETWVNKNMTPSKIWLDQDKVSALKMPQGKGERSIISHIGGESGFVPQARLIFRGAKALKDSDYHTEMNAEVFQDWMKKKVFKNIPAGSVIVLDRATYHQKLTEKTKPASSSLRKAEFAEWLVQKKIVQKI